MTLLWLSALKSRLWEMVGIVKMIADWGGAA
jgi:hypothetical protein